jgi:hypothetical protein
MGPSVRRVRFEPTDRPDFDRQRGPA